MARLSISRATDLAYIGDVPPDIWQYSPWFRAAIWVLVAAASLFSALIGSLAADQLLTEAFIPTLVAILVLRWLISSIPKRLMQRHQAGSNAEVEMSEAQEEAIRQPPAPSHFADAEAAVTEAEQSGRKDASVVEALTNLANLYVNQSRYAEAEPLFQRALEIQEEILGHEHPNVATSLNNLAEIYRAQWKYAEAEPLCRQALTILENALGREHLDVAVSLNNLALLYNDQGRYGEAQPLSEGALAIIENVPEPEDPGCGKAVNSGTVLLHNSSCNKSKFCDSSHDSSRLRTNLAKKSKEAHNELWGRRSQSKFRGEVGQEKETESRRTNAMADILILGGTVVTLDVDRRRIKDGAIAITGDRISHIGTAEELKNLQANIVLKADGDMVLPGFIDTHTHSQTSITALRGYGFELPWGGLYQRLMTIRVDVPDEDRYFVAMNGCLSQLRFGTTTIADWDFGETIVAEVVRDLGMRGLLSEYVYGIDFYKTRDAGSPVFSSREAERTLEVGLKLIDDWHGKENGRITCSLGPHAPDTCPPELLKEMRREARERGVRLNIHLAQTENEVQIVRDLYGKSPVEYLLDEGILGPQTFVAHCLYLNDEGIMTLKETGTSICVSPRIYARRGGSTPLMKFLSAGCKVGLATDGDPEMIRSMEIASVAAGFRDTFLGEGAAPAAQRVLELATIDAARVLGMEDTVGSLEIGKKADIIIVGMNLPHLVPNIDPVANLVYYGGGSDVKTVIIDGMIVMRDREVKTVDEATMLHQSQRAALDIWERYCGDRPE